MAEKEDEVPTIIRYSRRGFLTGSVKIGSEIVDVILSDSNNDAVYGARDWWGIQVRGAKEKADSSRSVGDFAWAGDRAWKLELDGTSGRSGRLVAFDPGYTAAEDARRRDPFREDRLAPRAKTPVAFSKECEKTIEAAVAKKSSYYVDFETTWCGPCKQMDAMVYTSKAVADSAHDVVCIKVDGDERKDLTLKWNVKAYPTGILFGPDGKELARYEGYRGVKQMAEFFKKARPQ